MMICFLLSTSIIFEKQLGCNGKRLVIIHDDHVMSENAYITRMVYESGRIALHGGVDHGVFVDLEHVAADALGFVILLAHVGEGSSDLLARVLDDHLASLYLALTIQPTANDA
jgi:hypothetical protein